MMTPGTRPLAPADRPVTGLFFGSFNPLHAGHVAIARHVLDEGLCAEVWFVVSPHNPFKAGDDLLPVAERLEIARAALAADPRMRACDVELSLPIPSYTFTTLEHLSALHPARTFCLILGGDNFLHIREWWRADEILRRYPLVVYPRPGVPLPAPPCPVAIITNAPLLPVSSTLVREKLARREDVSALVPPAALPLVERYYGPREHEAMTN
ncbi:MAG: nicotinate (nicotinamide) nucleotide adenylyltransferase [Odoribacteraceae bacterium]|jgi:nicotinate-nucleotide adenylyltransferase|nr:nicotinate (nicotinamide) nucleotide adenylyltransferase [Odoribacteraceae bacterium]